MSAHSPAASKGGNHTANEIALLIAAADIAIVLVPAITESARLHHLLRLPRPRD
jgi:hypothetical protein